MNLIDENTKETQATPLYANYKKESAIIEQKTIDKMNRPFTPLGKIISIISIILCIFLIYTLTARGSHMLLFGGIMFFYLLVKQIFALLYTPCKKELTKDYKVSVVITCYNEDPSSVVTVFENILALDYPVHEVLFLDDGSKDTTAYDVATSFADAHNKNVPKFNIIRFEENRGKRQVLADAFKLAKGDYVFLLDSDSEILPNALTELLRPFEDNNTTSCVGNIGILNKNASFVTRLQSLTYFGAFQMGRAGQSITGNVIICSGAFSIHKKEFVMQHLESFVKNTSFLGIIVSAGDDRALTSFSKESEGKTRYQSTAYCETKAPTTWKAFLKQRRRWQRSAYIGSLSTIRQLFPNYIPYLIWTFAEAYFWLVATIIFIISIIQSGFYFDLVDFIIYFAIMNYKHNIFYLTYNPIRFLLSPFYNLAYGVFLTIVRIYAFITIKNDAWGTRKVDDSQEINVPHVEDYQLPKVS